MSQQYHRIEVKILPHFFYVGDFGCDGDILRLHMIRGPATSPLVVVNEAERIGETIHFGQQVALVEVRVPHAGR